MASVVVIPDSELAAGDPGNNPHAGAGAAGDLEREPADPAVSLGW
jgi:hypothetical protein